MSSTADVAMSEELQRMADRVVALWETAANPAVDMALRHTAMYLELALSNLGEPVLFAWMADAPR